MQIKKRKFEGTQKEGKKKVNNKLQSEVGLSSIKLLEKYMI